MNNKSNEKSNVVKFRKTVLIITDNLPDQINGVVTTYKNIEKVAYKNNYDFVYLTPNDFVSFSFPGYKEIKLSIPLKIGKKIQKIDPDYIHIATEGPLGIAAKLFLENSGYKYNTAYHTKFPEALNELFWIPKKLTWSFLRWFHNHEGRVLTTTKSMVEQLSFKGIKNSSLVAWTRGVDRFVFNESSRERDDKEIILLCVSRLSKEKNLEAFCELQYAGAKKIMVGDGPYRSYLEKKYKDVQFVGMKTGDALAYYYANADVFVFPSKWDTFGIVMIEAMACGTPVAAYKCQGPSDVVEHSVTGFLSDDLYYSVSCAININRNKVFEGSKKWSWEDAWVIFRNNLIKVKS